MREILFRGKDVKGNWHIGLLAHIGNAWYISNKAGVATAYEIIPETVGQYTGLKDRNGKRIFEGDICKHISNYSGNTVISVVTYTDGHFLALVDEHSGFELSEKLEVIGNIHDNPELLKGEPSAE